MQIQRVQNNTSFGIKANKKQCLKVLGKLEPEIKKPLDSGINQFCNITQKHGVKGTFFPLNIRETKGNMVLKYKIINLHNNGGDRIFKYNQALSQNNNLQKNSLAIENKTILCDKNDSESYLDSFLSNLRDELNKPQQ